MENIRKTKPASQTAAPGLLNSPGVLVFTEERLNNQRQLGLDDEKVAGHGCRAKVPP